MMPIHDGEHSFRLALNVLGLRFLQILDGCMHTALFASTHVPRASKTAITIAQHQHECALGVCLV